MSKDGTRPLNTQIICLFRYTWHCLNEQNWGQNEDDLGDKHEAAFSQLSQTHTKDPLSKLQTCSLTPDLVRWCQWNAKILLCLVTCLCVHVNWIMPPVCASVCALMSLCVDVEGVSERASKITFIVQGGHPENIFEKDGTFLGQEALQREGRARLWHTHAHTHTQWR